MYLSQNQSDLLDRVCDRLEVALRSYVADILIRKNGLVYETYKAYLDDVADKYKADLLPFGPATYKEKANSIKKRDTFQELENAYKTFQAREEIGLKVYSVGTLVSFIIIFFNEDFALLSRESPSHKGFIDDLNTYHSVRNPLAHRGYKKITLENADMVLSLARTCLIQLDNLYFWLQSKEEIERCISDFICSLDEEKTILNNLDEAVIRHSYLVLRERELDKLAKYFEGEKYGRKAGSVEIHGYGGVGKTALSIEFCYEMLRREKNNEGLGYNFILWLSAKTEELAFQPVTGKIVIRECDPSYKEASDIIFHLNCLLSKQFNEEELLEYIYSQGLKGLIILDNLETIQQIEKQRIHSLMERFPKDIQFLITSRNYEGIGEKNLPLLGFVEEGSKFVNKYCEIKGYNIEATEHQINDLIVSACGNTLILVLSLERLIEGRTTINAIITELQLYSQSDVSVIVDFMYKNTFDTSIEEINSLKTEIDIRKMLVAMYLYGEGIDFHSLREVLDLSNTQQLELILHTLAHRFVIIKSHDLYKLHEFATKFVVLRFMPDAFQLKELQNKVSEYKTTLKNELKALYEAKNSQEVKDILNDWKAVDGPDTIAIAKSYLEYRNVNNKLQRIMNNPNKTKKLFDETLEVFKKIERRSNHPYVSLQKGKVLSLFLKVYMQREFSKQVSDLVSDAYYNAYHIVKFKNTLFAGTRSFAELLRIYGVHEYYRGNYIDCTRILEESVMNLQRFPLSAVRANSYLSLSYARLYIQQENEKYLNRSRATASEGFRLARGFEEQLRIELAIFKLMHTFSDVALNTFNPKTTRREIEEIKKILRSNNLKEFFNSIEIKLRMF